MFELRDKLGKQHGGVSFSILGCRLAPRALLPSLLSLSHLVQRHTPPILGLVVASRDAAREPVGIDIVDGLLVPPDGGLFLCAVGAAFDIARVPCDPNFVH